MITTLSVGSTSEYSYTTTEDCYINGWVAGKAGESAGYIQVDGIIIFAVGMYTANVEIGSVFTVFVSKGSSVKIRTTVAQTITVYGVIR